MSRALLVLDAYDEAGREGLARAGAEPAGALYHRLLTSLAPTARIDVVTFSSTAGFVLPTGRRWRATTAWCGPAAA
ncbi:MAG: hypothetical protein KC457_35820 [Myxococcales bacterium]|nr:hypothetical protein [Myxococcales bacterium]